jgi:hypothetical protein
MSKKQVEVACCDYKGCEAQWLTDVKESSTCIACGQDCCNNHRGAFYVTVKVPLKDKCMNLGALCQTCIVVMKDQMNQMDTSQHPPLPAELRGFFRDLINHHSKRDATDG